ncbi:Zinc finger RNA-binding protein [Actinidia chinensis var. chinensis]|uniref:Zinc finger RNA-binding protein n=1 Tax=Actinidia chinensis var. chinensis TaxID=1590841 RepID=A0A2R6R4U8_ACTCC|nr:Zinc finger RNA-binding protein [Actinidia chinensis var. chinensis]
MEFKFRAIDKQASSCRPPPSSTSYFAEQALRVGYSGPNPERSIELFRNPSDVRESILREMEKERIREEIIAAEIARKRLLEAEVRREMMLEREMALRRAEGFSFFSGSASVSTMLFEPRLSLLGQSEGRLLEERLALSLEERLGYRVPRGIGGFETFPFHRNSEPKISEVKPPPEVSKEKVIFLAKPEGNISGEKRKAVTPPPASEVPSVGSKKKLKEEWGCEMCQVSATSEQALKEHFQGKKHKAREAGQRTGKNYTIGLFPKKPRKPINPVEPTNSQNPEDEERFEGESLQVKKDNDLSLQIVHYTGDSKNKNEDSGQEKMQKIVQSKKRTFKFWCEMCQVGAFTEKVMNGHKMGKKHVGRLQELNQNSESVPDAPEAVTKDEKEETPDDVDGAAAENHQVNEESD